MLIRYKLTRPPGATLSLPVFGNIAIGVHRGYKVVDFQNLVVTKIFSEDVPMQEARRQIQACKLAANVHAAPRFLGEDTDGAWYSEEYVGGVHGTDSALATSGRFMEYYPDVERCLLALVGAGQPQTVDTSAYISALTDPALLDRWNDTAGTEETVTEVRLFQDQLKLWLSQPQIVPRLELVLSHGDFSLVNAIIADGRFRVIDWEGVRHGVLYADCLNFVFVETYYQRATTDITSDIAEVMRRYGEAVAGMYPGLKGVVEVPQAVSMRLYYLDRLHLMLEREVTGNLANVVRKSIRMFRDFDAAAGFPEI